MSDEQKQPENAPDVVIPPVAQPSAPVPVPDLPPVQLVSAPLGENGELHLREPPSSPLEPPPNLDPDLLVAFREGNPAVRQAVASGATTSQQVVDRMIQMGFTTGLPPQVQQLVDQRMEEVHKKNEAENRRLIETGKGVLAAAAFTWGFGDRDGYGAAGREESKADTSALFSKPWSEMNDFQRAAFLDAVISMNDQQWQTQLTDTERKQVMDSTVQSLNENLEKNKANRTEIIQALLNDTNLGATLEERQQAVALMEKANAEAKQKAMQEMGLSSLQMANLSQEKSDELGKRIDNILEEEYRALYQNDPEKAAYYTKQSRTLVANDKRDWDYTATRNNLQQTPNDPNERKRAETLLSVQKGGKESKYAEQDQKNSVNIAKEGFQGNSHTYGMAASNSALSKAEQEAHSLDTQNGTREMLESASKTTLAAEAYQARTENVQARKGADATAAKTEDRFSLGETEESSPRLTVNASALNGPTLNTLGAPETVAPAQTPPPAAPTLPPRPAKQAGMTT